MNHSFYLILTAIHILLWIVLYRLRTKKLDVFDPFYMVSILYGLIFVYAPFVWLERGQTTYQNVEVMRYLPVATLVFNVGYLAYCLGSIGLGLKFKQKTVATETVGTDGYSDFLDQAETKRYITRFAWVIFLGSMVLSLLYYRLIGRSLWFMLTMGQGAELDPIRGGQGIYFLMQFIRSAIPGLLLLIAFSKRWRPLIYVCAYVLCAVCISTGSRNLAICVVLAIFAYHYLKKGKRPSLFTVALAIVVLYLFVSIMGLFRGSIRSGAEIDIGTVSSDSMFGAFMFNVEIFYPFYTLVGYTGAGWISCHYGLGILNIPLQFIPRAIWAGKPATLGKTAMEAMYGDSMGGAAYPNIGEFYYELGIIGVIALMLLFGIGAKWLYQKGTRSQNPLGQICFCLAFGYILQFVCRGHFTSWALDAAFMFGPILLLHWLLKQKYQKQTKKHS